MKALLLLLLGADLADDPPMVTAPLVSAARQAELPPIVALQRHQPRQSAAVAAYLAQPRNVGRCPCGATGYGCHCSPSSICGREPCNLHNPLLSGPRSSTAETATIQAPVTVLQPNWAPVVDRCPLGGCPQSQAPGRVRLFRR